MNTTILPSATVARRSLAAAQSQPAAEFTTPHFDSQPHENALRIVVWVPGVESAGVEITTRDSALTVTARKSHVLRRNWQSLHLEGFQRDYQLSLRLGRNLDYNDLRAELIDGVLTIDLPMIARER